MRSLKFTTKSGPTKIQGKFIQFKKDPFKFKIIFKKTRTSKIFQIQGEEEKNGKFIPIFLTVPRHMGGNSWIFHFSGRSASYSRNPYFQEISSPPSLKYFLFLGEVRVSFTFHFLHWTTPYILFFLCSSITSYLLSNFIHFFFHNSIVTIRYFRKFILFLLDYFRIKLLLEQEKL